MQHLDEYRDRAAVSRLIDAINRTVTRPWAIMEICGGQTHTIVKYGLDELLPKGVTLIHGPGCPVCVTDSALIDRAIRIASRPEVILCSFGDMLRVPGSGADLLSAKASGADIRTIYSPLDGVKLSASNPDRQIVFFAVGFETTAPAAAMAVKQARALSLANFSILSAHVLVPPAVEMILASPDVRVQGFLAAGHVCTVMGYWQYEPIAARHNVPIVVTGFEPVDILQGVLLCLKQLESGRSEVDNQYARSVVREGNRAAQALMSEVFHIVDRTWRGIGMIPQSGMDPSPPFAEFDANLRYPDEAIALKETTEGICIAGLVLRGVSKPTDCPAFGSRCSPDHPLGAPMVSSEGACAAYYRYRAHTQQPNSALQP